MPNGALVICMTDMESDIWIISGNVIKCWNLSSSKTLIRWNVRETFITSVR